MDIYEKLLPELQALIRVYFQHPIAELVNDNKEYIITLTRPPILSLIERYRLGKGIGCFPRQRCGCVFWEEHQVVCNDVEPEKLPTWDWCVQSTPIQQALLKLNVLYELLLSTLPYNP